MNLQEFLDYTNKCIICQNDLEISLLANKDSKIEISSEGLKITSLSKDNFLFTFDGVCKRDNVNRNFVLIKKQCPDCITSSKDTLIPLNINEITNFVGAKTTLIDLKKKGCSSTFGISIDDIGNYEINLLSEYIRFCNEKEFWHLNTNYTLNSDKKTTLHNGIFENNIHNMLTLYLPLINLISIKTIDQFINKFKLYSLFS